METEHDDEPEKFTKPQKFAVVILCINQFMFTCAISLIAPIYPRELSERGGDELIAGIVLSFASFLLFCFAPVFGKLAPKFGVKTTLISGLIIAGVGNILFGTITYIKDKMLFITLSFLFRAVESIGATAFVTTSNVVVSGVFPNDVGFVRGIIEIFISSGYSIGPALGGLLYSLGGFQLPFMFLGTLMIIMGLLNKFIKFVEKEDQDKKESGLILKMLRTPSVLLTSLILITLSITWSFLNPTLEPHLRKYTLTPEYVGLIFLMYSATFGITGFIAGWISDKKPNYKWVTMISGMVLVSLILLLLGPTNVQSFLKESLASNLVAIGILGAALGFAAIPTYQCMAEGAIAGGLTNNISTQSAISAVWVSSYTFGHVLGPVTAGLLYTSRGFAFTTDLLAIVNCIVAIMIVIYRFYHNVKGKNVPRKESLGYECDNHTDLL